MKTDTPDRVTLGEVEHRRPDTLTPYRFRYITIPDLLPEDQAQLESSIGRYGITEPLIVLADHRILDGHHRHAIALKRGLARIPVRVAAFADPFAIEWYAVESALVRRHLTPARKVQLAEPLAQAEAEHARLRRLATLKQFQGSVDALRPDPSPKGKTLQRIAAKIGISTRVAERIMTVMEKGPPGLFERLARGDIKPDAAYRQTIEALEKEGQEKGDAKAPAGRAPQARRPVRKAFKRAMPPPRPRMPEATPAALREIDASVTGWIEESRGWPAEDQAVFWTSLTLLASRIEELLHILSQYIRGDPVIPASVG